jgi:serine/threonine protein kinase
MEYSLGEGGFADVGCLESNGQIYAVKFLRDQDDLEHLKNELRVLKLFAADGNPLVKHTITCVDTINAIDGSLQALVLQPVGTPISKLNAEDIKLDKFNGIKDALRYAHEKHNIVHCDVRPCNIIVAKGRYILIDWGIAAYTGTKLSDLYGVTAFLHDDILESPTDYVVSPKHDWASLVYTILTMRFGMEGRAPWHHFLHSEPLQTKCDRDAWIDKEMDIKGPCNLAKEILQLLSAPAVDVSEFVARLEGCLVHLAVDYMGGREGEHTDAGTEIRHAPMGKHSNAGVKRSRAEMEIARETETSGEVDGYVAY